MVFYRSLICALPLCIRVRSENLAMTQTSSFGTSKREGHDSSVFYQRNIYTELFNPEASSSEMNVEIPAPDSWANRIYTLSSTNMADIPDNSIALAFTSPPYNVGKEYDLSLIHI